MAGVAETKKLVENIVRLRRAERVPSAAAEVAPVRRDLEAQLGPMLSRSRASSILGVSQTALDRWVDAGQVPVVVTPRGRRAVPARFVIELREGIDSMKDERVAHHPLAAALAARRKAAQAIDLTVSPAERRLVPRGHETAERRGFAYHRTVAARLDELLRDEASARLERLAAQGHIDPPYADRWREILALPIDALAERITEDSQEARDLRQNSPFAGVLNEQERRRIIELVR